MSPAAWRVADGFDSFLISLLDGEGSDGAAQSDTFGSDAGAGAANQQKGSLGSSCDNTGKLQGTAACGDDVAWRCLVQHAQGEVCACSRPPLLADESLFELVGDQARGRARNTWLWNGVSCVPRRGADAAGRSETLLLPRYRRGKITVLASRSPLAILKTDCTSRLGFNAVPLRFVR